jgi:hypothetical protein
MHEKPDGGSRIITHVYYCRTRPRREMHSYDALHFICIKIILNLLLAAETQRANMQLRATLFGIDIYDR